MNSTSSTTSASSSSTASSKRRRTGDNVNDNSATNTNNGTSFLGELVPRDPAKEAAEVQRQPIGAEVREHPFSVEKLRRAVRSATATDKRVDLIVASENALKIKAARDAFSAFLSELLGSTQAAAAYEVNGCGKNASSQIEEQPFQEVTWTGCHNRLLAIRDDTFSSNASTSGEGNGSGGGAGAAPVRVEVSMENGLFVEPLPHNKPLNNPEVFVPSWERRDMIVDRCCVAVRVVVVKHQQQQQHQPYVCVNVAKSEGVTTPYRQYLESAQSEWTKTAGFFIAKKYGWNEKDWHGAIAGKPRATIMTEAICAAFGLPFHMPLLPVTGAYKPDTFHQYTEQAITFFTDTETRRLIDAEKSLLAQENGAAERSVGDAKLHEEIQNWRAIYAQIPMPIKPGADGKNPENCVGVITAEDLLALYFDEGVLHAVLVWGKELENSSERGWALLGKRDRAYGAGPKPDISLEDANYQLVEKELSMDRSQIDYLLPVCYFNDRMREPRMRTSSFFSVALLSCKPACLEDGKIIGVPFNLLMEVARRQVRIPRHASDPLDRDSCFALIRNHDSLLLAAAGTGPFHQILRAFLVNENRPRNPASGRRLPLPDFVDDDLCGMCADLMVDPEVVCANGHTYCGKCADSLASANSTCPQCRQRLLAPRIPNVVLAQIIHSHYPEKYNSLASRPLDSSVFLHSAIKDGKFVQIK
jgi:hypothetical protein